MPRPKKNIDLSTYTNLGTIHWKELIKERSTAQVLKDFLPNRQMLMPGGYTHEKVTDPKDNNETGTIQNIVFDSEYLHYYLHYRILEPIGWFVGGKVDQLGFNTFLTQQLQYSENIPRQAYLEGIRSEAKRLALAFPHKTEEQWYQDLLGTVDDTTPKENGSATKSKSTAKV